MQITDRYGFMNLCGLKPGDKSCCVTCSGNYFLILLNRSNNAYSSMATVMQNAARAM